MYVCMCIYLFIYLFIYSFINLSNSQARYEVIVAVIMKTPCVLTFCCVSADQNFPYSCFYSRVSNVLPS